MPTNSPFKLDPEKLAGHGLEDIPPWPPEAILEGESKHRRCIFFQGDIVVEVYEVRFHVPSAHYAIAKHSRHSPQLETAIGSIRGN